MTWIPAPLYATGATISMSEDHPDAARSSNTESERELWQNVLLQAIRDLNINPGPLRGDRRHDQEQAEAFFRNGGAWFNKVCRMAGFDPERVQDTYRAGKLHGAVRITT